MITESEQQTEIDAEEPRTIAEVVDRLPSNFEVEQRPGELVLVEHWFRWIHAGALVLVAAIGFVVAQYGTLSVIGPGKEQVPVWFAWTLLGVISMVAYWGVAGCVNTTKLTVTDQFFSRDVGPLPWFGSFEVAAEEVDQFFVRRHTTTVERNHFWDWEGDHTTDSRGGFSMKYSKTVSRYRLSVQLTNGRRRRISNKYCMPYTPRMVEVIVEAVLGIQDRFVRGEVRGRVHA